MVENYDMSENMGSNTKAARYYVSELKKTTNYADDPKSMTKH